MAAAVAEKDPHEHCCKGHFVPESVLAGSGVETTIAGVPAYVVKGTKNAACVISTDIFGWKLPNARLLAEQITQSTGHTCIVPDICSGDWCDAASFDRTQLPAWFAKHGDEQTVPIVTSVLKALRADGGYAFLSILGFCWGARYACIAAQGPAPLVDAYGVGHPTKTAPEDFAATAVPGIFLLAETDQAFPAEAVAATKALLADKSGPFEFVGPFEGTVHGFVVRGNDEDERVAAARQAARAAAGAFFTRLADAKLQQC